MTNAEKFKTAEERRSAYDDYWEECAKEDKQFVGEFSWLELEYKEELKPCPFCGSEASLNGDTEDHYVTCRNNACTAAFVARSFQSPEEAIAAWNRRAK